MDQRRVDHIWVWAGRIMLLGLTVFATTAASTWSDLQKTVIQNSQQIEVLKSGQFTASQGHALEARLVARMQDPPRWLTDSVGRLERAAEKIDAQVEGIQERLARLEATLKK
jgi:hypothetical protein